MSIVEVDGLSAADLQTLTQLPNAKGILGIVKLVAGNFPSGFQAEALTVEQLVEIFKSLIQTPVNNLADVAYPTLVEALTHMPELLEGKLVLITNDGANNGLYLSDGVTLVKTDYDAIVLPTVFRDIQTIMDVVKLNENTDVTSQYGDVFYTLKKALYQVIQTGGFEPFLTQSALLASVPTVSKKAAVALDTGKIWYWNGSSWTDTGWGAPLSIKPNLNNENLNDVTTLGLYRQIDNAKTTISNNYPTDVNGAGVLEVVNNNGLVIQEYTTWYNRKFRRTKYSTFDFLAWQEVPNAVDIVLYYKPNLGTEDLDTVLTSGIYRQMNDANASAGNHYPTATNGAGILEVINRGNLVIQEYTTWYGLRFCRTKYSTFAFSAWQKYTTQTDLSSYLGIKTPLLTTDDLDNLTTFGIYRQTQDSNATPERHYPNVTNAAGVLEVINHNGLVIQQYTTWLGRKFWRTKYSTYAFGAWNEVASVSSINTPYKGKNIAWFGDSIVEGNNHPNRIATLLGATVSKFGFASHTMAQYVGSPLGRDKGSMYRFAKAINTGDWTDVIAGGEWVRDNLGDNNMPQINAMVATDWNTVDYIMIAFGTNDIYATTPLGELTDVADATGATFVGATKYIIEQIQTAYPHIQIMFVSPVFRTRWFQTPNPDRPEQNSDTLLDPQGKKYTDYIDALLHMKNLYHVPVFDFYRTSGLNIRTWSHYLSDGVHPKENGIQLWTKKISAFMLSN